MQQGNNICALVRAAASGILALGLLAGCASTPREVSSSPVKVFLDSQAVASLPGLAPRLATYSDGRTLLVVNPAEQWAAPRMARPELQQMVDQCQAAGRQVVRLRRAVLSGSDGKLLATFINGGDQPLADLAGFSGREVNSGAQPAVLALKLDPSEFHGQLREEVELVFRDGEAQIIPGVFATVDSMTGTPQEVQLGNRVARINYLYVKLVNRSSDSYTLNGHDSGAFEARSNRMLTAESLHGTVIGPGRAVVVRLPVELSGSVLDPNDRRMVDLASYLGGEPGVTGREVAAVIPLRVQIELKRSGGDMQRGVLTPVLQVQKRYHIERAGCFD